MDPNYGLTGLNDLVKKKLISITGNLPCVKLLHYPFFKIALTNFQKQKPTMNKLDVYLFSYALK